ATAIPYGGAWSLPSPKAPPQPAFDVDRLRADLESHHDAIGRYPILRAILDSFHRERDGQLPGSDFVSTARMIFLASSSKGSSKIFLFCSIFASSQVVRNMIIAPNLSTCCLANPCLTTSGSSPPATRARIARVYSRM